MRVSQALLARSARSSRYLDLLLGSHHRRRSWLRLECRRPVLQSAR